MCQLSHGREALWVSPELLPQLCCILPGFSPPCNNVHSAGRRLCLTQHVPRDCGHLDHDQHDQGCKSRNVQRHQRWGLAFRFVDQLALFHEEDHVIHLVVLPKYQEDKAMLRETLEHLRRSPLAEKHTRVVSAMVDREGPNTQDKAERLMAATAHLFEDVMAAHHPPGIAGEVADKIIQHPMGLPTALEEIWCRTSPA